MSRALTLAMFCSILVSTAPAARAQVFVRNTTSVPTTTTGYTENVDFADVDNDGDWDAAFADGGDFGPQQNRIWINQGHAQAGTVGFFLDETASRLPVISDPSRDVEFADLDADGDLDLQVSNDSGIVNTPCRFWINTGGLQGGAPGFFVDQTQSRWVGLGGPGSSVPPPLLLGSGGFLDFVSDSDFADFDNDGDLDLLHSSHGPAYNGQAPTRIFLNDGLGFFSEFNPSGFQLAGTNIQNGNPGLWCQGIQQANTTDATGANCDIASTAIDVDVGDIDGDLDLDILHGARSELPRMFQNRLQENAGVLSFRDVTGAVFPPGYASGNGHYEQEFGDLDADGDLDICGLNWQVTTGFNFNDVVLHNQGDGTYATAVALPSSGADDEEVDCIDYDNDGDLDLVMANFSGQERMYVNDSSGSFTLGVGIFPPDSTTSRDIDMSDVDFDGDYDLFVANSQAQAEWYLQNTLGISDTTAPTLLRLEQAPDRTASGAPTVVRVQAYDNTADYTTWYDTVSLEVTVNGGPVQLFPMRASMGQVFRGEIDGRLVGAITYRAIASDEYGNTGSTPTLSYTAAAGSSIGVHYCFGDGSTAVGCPCGNTGLPGHGCENSGGTGGAELGAIGTTSPDTVALQATGLLPTPPAIFLQGSAIVANGVVFGDGVRCVGGTLKRLALEVAINGSVNYPGAGDPSISARSAALGDPIAPGSARYYQVYYRDPDAVFCAAPNGATWNVSSALMLVW